jgi:peptidoglycan/xylan/chitin deacetylase (PgdA/CDA1 family)
MVATLKERHEIIPLADAIRAAATGALPRSSVSITFDDGYADNYTNALPILEKHQAAATFFVATAFLDGGIMWNDKIIETVRSMKSGPVSLDDGIDFDLTSQPESRKALIARLISSWKHLDPATRQDHVDRFARHAQAMPDDLMMTSEQLRAMSRSPLAEVGGHTDTHPILLSQPENEAHSDIATGKRKLNEITGTAPRIFAYPNGKLGRDFSQVHVDAVREAGFEAAVTTDMGCLTRNTDPFLVPRFSPWTRNRIKFQLDLMRARYGLI